MTVQYQMAEQEATHGILKLRQRLSRFRWLRFGGTIAGTAMLTLLLLNPWRYTDAVFRFACLVACLAAIIVVILYRWYLRNSLAKYVHRNAAIYAAPYTLSFNETGVTFSSPTTKQENVWNAFTHRWEDEQFIYLFSRLSGAASVVPKRAFDDASRAEFLRCSQSLQQA